MASVVKICNRALTQLGANLITSLDDSSTEANVMKAAFDEVRDAVLREAKPACATFRATLVKSATGPAFGWNNSYQLPTDPYCLAVLKMNETDDHRDWEVEGRQLVTDYSSAKIKYIGRVTDTGQIDPLTVTAIALRLAAETCYAITQNASKEDRMWKKADEALTNAQIADGHEKGSEVVIATRFQKARQ